MTGSDDRRTVIVGWLKVLLPLAALALLSVMFLFARGPGPATDIPYAEIEEIARDNRIDGAAFSGVTDDGSALSLSAAQILPLDTRPDAFAVTDPRAELVAPDGASVTLTAGSGEFDGRAQTARLSGLARLVASSGYQMETAGAVADLRAGTFVTEGPLEVRAPFGELTAGGLTVLSDGGRQQMVFNGGVRLLYRTGQTED